MSKPNLKPKNKIGQYAIGDVVVYANQWRDQIVGFPLSNGRQMALVRPMDGRQAWSASDALKELDWLDSMIKAKVFTLVKGIDGVDPETGTVVAPGDYDRCIIEAALMVASGNLAAAKAKHGTDDLANFRDEWELKRRLEALLSSMP